MKIFPFGIAFVLSGMTLSMYPPRPALSHFVVSKARPIRHHSVSIPYIFTTFPKEPIHFRLLEKVSGKIGKSKRIGWYEPFPQVFSGTDIFRTNTTRITNRYFGSLRNNTVVFPDLWSASEKNLYAGWLVPALQQFEIIPMPNPSTNWELLIRNSGSFEWISFLQNSKTGEHLIPMYGTGTPKSALTPVSRMGQLTNVSVHAFLVHPGVWYTLEWTNIMGEKTEGEFSFQKIDVHGVGPLVRQK